jgi:hypothetical protein
MAIGALTVAMMALTSPVSAASVSFSYEATATSNSHAYEISKVSTTTGTPFYNAWKTFTNASSTSTASNHSTSFTLALANIKSYTSTYSSSSVRSFVWSKSKHKSSTDLSPVPLPPALLLFGSAVLLLVARIRLRKPGIFPGSAAG